MKWRRKTFIVTTFAVAVVTIAGLYFIADAGTVWRLTRNAPLASWRAPRDAALRFEIGNYYFGGGTYDIRRAKKYYDEAYLVNPTLAGLNYQLARVYFIWGDFYTARVHINKELELYPDYKRSYYVRGLINGYSGYYSDAEKDFKEFLDWKPESWAGYNDLAWIYFAQGKYKEARDAALSGLLYNETSPWLNNSLGVSLLNLGQKEEAKVYLEKSLASFERIGPAGWGNAYPGNDPVIYGEGFASVIASIKKNISLAEEGDLVD